MTRMSKQTDAQRLANDAEVLDALRQASDSTLSGIPGRVYADAFTDGLMSSQTVSELLGIPLVAVGQIVFDGRLVMVEFDQFLRSDVERLAQNEQDYVASLR